MGNWHRIYICTSCGHKIEQEGASDWRKCPKCDERMYDKDKRPQRVIDTPSKGDRKYYSEGWFRKSEKEWHNDIKSRRIVNGQVIRVNSKGKRIA
jgi:DNA-directed RNA polymerase subunit RPC12/RpoP